MKKHILLTTVLTMSLSFSAAFVSLAGQWQQDSTGWWYQEDNNNYSVNSWKELDGKWYYFNQDGYMVSNTWIGNYYLGSDGAMLINTTTPDGYSVGPDGAWIQDVTNNLPTRSYASIVGKYNKEDIRANINFRFNDFIDHGEYYELKNQEIWLYSRNEVDEAFDVTILYKGSLYFYRNITTRNNEDLFGLIDLGVGVDIDGEYHWTLLNFDEKGYATTFEPGQAG